MESIKLVCSLVNKHDYMTSVDLKDAFLHVLIHHSSRKYLQFQWKGRHYQFRVLPFGLSLAPFVFTKVLKPILRWARRKGIRLTAYLDDCNSRNKGQSQGQTGGFRGGESTEVYGTMQGYLSIWWAGGRLGIRLHMEGGSG